MILRLTVEVDFEAAVDILAASLAISRRASALVAEPLPTSEADFPGYRAMITALDQPVEALSGKGHPARVQQIATLVNHLKANTNLILRDRPALLHAVVAESGFREGLTENNRGMLFPAAAASVDHQFYDVMTNVGGGAGTAGNLSDEDILATPIWKASQET